MKKYPWLLWQRCTLEMMEPIKKVLLEELMGCKACVLWTNLGGLELLRQPLLGCALALANKTVVE